MRQLILAVFMFLSLTSELVAFQVDIGEKNRELIISKQTQEKVFFEARDSVSGLQISGIPFPVSAKIENNTLFIAGKTQFIPFTKVDSAIQAAYVIPDPDYVTLINEKGQTERIFLNPLENNRILFEYIDPEGDEYVDYPTNSVFRKGVFDIIYFRVYKKRGYAFFQIKFDGELTNPWNAPNDFSLQNIDIYVGQKGVGAYEPGRFYGNLPISPDLVINVNGFSKRVISQGRQMPANTIKVYAVPEYRSVYVAVPLSFVKLDVGTRFYLCVTGYDGYAPNSIRVVGSTSSEWNFGVKKGREKKGNIVDDILIE